MDLNKSIDYFNPASVPQRIHVIGCGSVGSAVGILLARMGLTKLSFYDFDFVEPHNLGNQMFTRNDLGRNKAAALKDMVLSINPDAELDIRVFENGYKDEPLSGYVFLCVDNIDLRRQIAEANRWNVNIKAMFDFRTGLEDAAHYAAEWRDASAVKKFIGSMNYTHDEAKAETPVSACGVTLGVMSTVWMVSLLGVNNFLNYVKGKGLKPVVLMNAFENGGTILAMN